MRLSKVSYYADFVIFPLLIFWLGRRTLDSETFRQQIGWLAACLAGIATWTLIEYLAHRFVLHGVPAFARMHAAHHDDPKGFVGTPAWLSSAIAGLVIFLLWWRTEFDLASGLTVGLMMGYLWYVALHHVGHHWEVRNGTWLYRVKRRHALHHYSRTSCNFGVTTGVWDHVFGTTAGRR